MEDKKKGYYNAAWNEIEKEKKKNYKKERKRMKKEWKNVQKNYEPSIYDPGYKPEYYNKPNVLKIIIELIIIITLVMTFDIDKITKIIADKTKEQDTTITTNNKTNYPDGYSWTNSNKNGRKMNKSIKEIRDIIMDIDTNTIEENEEAIKKIENINLSKEYDEFKSNMKQKIILYNNYLITGNIQYAENSNKINYIEELAKAFDKANIQYTIENDEIRYRYKLK